MNGFHAENIFQQKKRKLNDISGLVVCLIHKDDVSVCEKLSTFTDT